MLFRSLEKHHRPTVDEDTIRAYVGKGALKLIERGISDNGNTPDRSLLKKVEAEFLVYYQANIANKSRPFPGVVDALTTFSNRGTLPALLCVGLGEACTIAGREMAQESERLHYLRDRLYKGITEQLPEVYLNGDLDQRIPGNLNFSFAYVEGESLMMGIKNLCVSSGSACTSASLEPSYVLRALGVSEDLAHTSLRLGIGRFTTEDEMDKAVTEIVTQVKKLRELSPLWEMAQEGIDIGSVEWAAH